jgi:hypothetical protein
MPAEAPAPVRPVLVAINQAQHELVADLSAIGSRYRAERLRTLALIGLAVLRGGIGATPPPPTAPVLSPDPSLSPDPQWQRRLRLFDRIAPDE